jgi:hypothetical protein
MERSEKKCHEFSLNHPSLSYHWAAGCVNYTLVAFKCSLDYVFGLLMIRPCALPRLIIANVNSVLFAILDGRKVGPWHF